MKLVWYLLGTKFLANYLKYFSPLRLSDDNNAFCLFFKKGCVLAVIVRRCYTNVCRIDEFNDADQDHGQEITNLERDAFMTSSYP